MYTIQSDTANILPKWEQDFSNNEGYSYFLNVARLNLLKLTSLVHYGKPSMVANLW